MLLEPVNMPAERAVGGQGRRMDTGHKGNELPADGGPESLLTTLATDQSPVKRSVNLSKKNCSLGVLPRRLRKCQRPCESSRAAALAEAERSHLRGWKPAGSA